MSNYHHKYQQVPAKCPACGQEDYCEFAFIAHSDTKTLSFGNPSDYSRIYLCPNLHVYAFTNRGDCEIVELKETEEPYIKRISSE